MNQPLQILSYNPRWVVEFETERDRIAHVIGVPAIRIEHNGSTAVPGLNAKPIIDIQIAVKQLQPIARYTEPLATLGYLHVPHFDDAFCPFFHRPSEWPHTHHVHVVEAVEREERRTLAFCDFLREHGDVAREYAALKHRLAALSDATSADSREAYASAKSEFIERVVQVALAGYPRGLVNVSDFRI
jgi:GrpB-like predicted nucleotidyltransferase (UPF0157 family)